MPCENPGDDHDHAGDDHDKPGDKQSEKEKNKPMGGMFADADAIKAEILTKVGLASRVFTPSLRLDCEERREIEVKAHTRKGFRNFRTYERKD